MKRFDCLSRDCPLFGPHLLEASAGTGKTFSIEHVYVRLILESIEVEQILVVTFTRAATRELKARIRANLEKALQFLQAKEAHWEYLQSYLDSEIAIRHLSDALAGFDRCQIFTIHGFCHRMLKEFAFEAGVCFSTSDVEETKGPPDVLKKAARDFLENGIEESLLCVEQLSLLFKQFESFDELVNRLLRLKKPAASYSFSELFAKCKAALHLWAGGREGVKLLEDFQAIAKGYKAEVKGNFEEQVVALTDLENPRSFGLLLKERGSLFKFLSPENKKVKAIDPGALNYPGFFEWARLHIAPLLEQEVLPVLQGAWNLIAEKILAEEEHLDPDQILLFMGQAIQTNSFAGQVRKKYVAAIVDEFQDTDALQWEIFQTLFAELRALYLVGDPKQSIYRFRKADVYTYLKARDFLGEDCLYQLDTNFRSSKSLVEALNSLFARDWLRLPKVNRTLPYVEVQAGAKVDSCFGDEKGAVHFCVAEGEPNALFDEIFLPFAAAEIERLNLQNCALLVKDRYSAEKALHFLRNRNISAVAKSHTALGQTVAFQAIRELFEAVLSPRDQSAIKIVMAGPFSSPDLSFFDLKLLLKEEGLVPFARLFSKVFDTDMMQIFELLFEWERNEGFSFEGLKRCLKTLERLDSEEGRRRVEVDEQAIQIMTMHVSKGLEFDVVFALGLASRTPEASHEVEELDAEKLRQLYVAMTRAKRRLYVPLALSRKDPNPGSHSPMELFLQYLGLEGLKDLTRTHSITMEMLSAPYMLGPVREKSVTISERPVPIVKAFSPSYLSSFTSLARVQDQELKRVENAEGVFTLQTMPRGAETGIVVHKIFELLFSSSVPIWREPKAIHTLVSEQVQFTALEPWKEVIQKMVCQVVILPLQVEEGWISLNELKPEQIQVEVEFLYPSAPHFVKGFIDLIFSHREKVYFLDWKTNWLESYEEAVLKESIQLNNYNLQASLYAEAIQRHSKGSYGGAFYIFVRGGTYATL